MLHFHGVGGDTSLEEILPTLTGGGTLVLDDGAREGFARVAKEQQVSVAVLPTGFWDSLTGDLLHHGARLPASLRTVVIGGEAVRADMLERWHRVRGAEDVRLLNTYGSTETALVTHAVQLAGPGAPVLPETGGDLPIGLPLAHVGQLVDESGELYVSGPGLALGYHDDPGRRPPASPNGTAPAGTAPATWSARRRAGSWCSGAARTTRSRSAASGWTCSTSRR